MKTTIILLILVILFAISLKPTKLIAEDVVASPCYFNQSNMDCIKNLVNRYAKKYQVSSKKMLAIISCESQNDPNSVNENIRKGKVWSRDRGLMQLNDFFQKDEAEKMGLSIYNMEDNVEFGAYLMSKQGTIPWSASRKCWSRAV